MIQDHRNLGLTGKEDEEELKKCKQRLTDEVRHEMRRARWGTRKRKWRHKIHCLCPFLDANWENEGAQIEVEFNVEAWS